MRYLTPKSVVGIVLLLLGVFLPSSMIVGLRSTTASGILLEQLQLGAMLLKVSLAVLGLFILVTTRLSILTRHQTKKPLFDGIPLSDIYVLVAILFAATALRFYRLGDGLWFDEIVTYVKYVRVPLGEVLSTYDNQNQHLFYSLLGNLAIQLFGDSAWSLRLPAVLFGLGSIGAIYLLGREVANSREALISAALIAFSYHHVWFSQNARGYTGLLFFTILASWLFLRALRTGSSRLWALYAVAVSLGAYTLIYMVFVVLGHIAIYLATIYHDRKMKGTAEIWTGLIFGFILSGILTFLLHALVLPQFLEAFANPEVGGPIWTHPLWGILEFAKGMQINFSGSLVALCAIALFGAGLWNYALKKPAVVGLLLIPSITCVALKVLLGHHLWPRSLFFVMGFGALVVVRGIMLFGELACGLMHRLRIGIAGLPWPKGWEGLVGVVFCTVLVLVSALSVPFAYGPKQDFQGALAFVENHREPDDAVVTVGLATFPYKNLYKTDWKDIETLNALDDIRTRSKRTWLVYTIPIQLQDSFPEINASVRNDFREVKQFGGTLNGGTVFVCEGDPVTHPLAKLE